MRAPLLVASLVVLLDAVLVIAWTDGKSAGKSASKTKPRASAKPAAAPTVKASDLETVTNSLGMKFVRIPAGSFDMGADAGFDDQVPVHRVTISKDFFLAVTEVTQGQYEAVMDDNPSQHAGPGELPVDTVSWLKAVEFCEKLSEKEVLKYRLPTEAEWEYACRAGSNLKMGPGEGGVEVTDENVDEYAWLRLNSDSTHPVARKKPNAWGLYDMHGNVFEWCQDNWLPYSAKAVTDPVAIAKKAQQASGEFYVLRGGSYEWGLDDATAAARCRCKKLLRSRTVGFRVVRSLESGK